MPNSMAEASDAECGGDEEVRAEVNNGEEIPSPDEVGDYSNCDSTAGLNGGEEEERLPAKIERYPTEYNYRGSSSEAVFQKKRSEDGDFGNMGPDNKDTELRLGLPETKASNPGVRVPDPACSDGVLQGGRITQNNLSRNELNAFVPRCSLDSQARANSIPGQEYASKEEFKLKPMFREFSSLDLPFDARFSLARPHHGSSTGAKRIFSETLESSRVGGFGEPKLYLPPPLPSSSFNFPFAGGPTAWRMKWEQQPQQQNKTGYGQFSGHMIPNEINIKEAATLPVNTPGPDQKGNPAESQPPRNETTSSEQRAAPVVGWPPVRSFRRNIASTPKIAPTAQPAPAPVQPPPVEAPVEKKPATMFVKVNVEGVPIGRKIDLKAYDRYDKLSVALDDMFRNSIPVQNPSSSSGNPPFSLSSGDYVLVYEDDEGDRMLVGDVPWGMFVTTVKRLRVMRSSEARGLADRESSHKAKEDRSS